MGVMVYSLLWVLQALYDQRYQGFGVGFGVWGSGFRV